MEVARSVHASFFTKPETPSSLAPASTPATVDPLLYEEQKTPFTQKLKEGFSSAGANLGTAGAAAGGFVLRTLAEGGAISIAAVIAGIGAGSASRTFLFLLLAMGCGMLIGIAVGLVIKRSIFVLFSAPFGALVGLLAAMLLHLNAEGTPWSALIATGGACLLSLLGGHRGVTNSRTSTYQHIRPILGALGGIFFGFIGYLIGLLF